MINKYPLAVSEPLKLHIYHILKNKQKGRGF